MFTLLKGILIGLGKILPGVSGSLIAIAMGVYEKTIKIISSFKIKENMFYLFTLCTGILFGITVGSKIIYYFLNKYYFLTMCVIIGLISSTIPSVLKEEKPNNKKDYMYILVSFLIIIMIGIFKNDFVINKHLENYLIVIILGFIDAVTMIIPGVSGTAIFMMLGAYEFVLAILGNPINIYIPFFGIGLLLGIIIMTKLINYWLNKYRKIFYLTILSFSLMSLLLVGRITFTSSYTIIELVISPLFIITGIVFGLFLNNK